MNLKNNFTELEKSFPSEEKNIFIEKLTDNIKTENLNLYFDDLLRLKNSQPVIYIGTGTCGLGAGAYETLEQIKKYLSEKKINAKIIEVGCIGLCSSEPLVDI